MEIKTKAKIGDYVYFIFNNQLFYEKIENIFVIVSNDNIIETYVFSNNNIRHDNIYLTYKELENNLLTNIQYHDN